MRLRPHTVLIGTLAIAGMLAAGSARAEFSFPPDQAAAKLTAAAKKLRAPFPFKHKLCVTEERTGCAFLAGSIVGMATGPSHGKAERIDLIYPDEGEASDMPITWGILMALVSPEMAKNDRGALAVRFLRAAAEPSLTSLTEERGAVTYTISRDHQFGLMFTAESDAP